MLSTQALTRALSLRASFRAPSRNHARHPQWQRCRRCYITSVWFFRPVNDGVSINGDPISGFGVVQLNGASNVTIDGDNPNTTGTHRDLTIINSAINTTTFGQVVRIALATTGNDHADNDTIKNLNLVGSATGRNISTATSTTGSENTTYGVLAGGGVPQRPEPRLRRSLPSPRLSAPERRQII